MKVMAMVDGTDRMECADEWAAGTVQYLQRALAKHLWNQREKLVQGLQTKWRLSRSVES